MLSVERVYWLAFAVSLGLAYFTARWRRRRVAQTVVHLIASIAGGASDCLDWCEPAIDDIRRGHVRLRAGRA
jgi:hypothetical protein